MNTEARASILTGRYLTENAANTLATLIRADTPQHVKRRINDAVNMLRDWVKIDDRLINKILKSPDI